MRSSFCLSVIHCIILKFTTNRPAVKPKFHCADFATKSGTKTQQSPLTCRGHKSRNSATQITSPTFMICVRDKSATLSGTCPKLCRRLCRRLSPCIVNSITATQTGLSRTCHGLCRKHLDMSRWFLSATFMICVHDFPRGEVSVKVGVMEFGL